MIDTVTDRYNLYSRLLPRQGDQIDQSGVTWVYFNQPPANTMRCDIYYNVLFPLFRYISSRCRECFKVVVKPQTVVELFNLYELMRKQSYHCKCGLDTRELTEGTYHGFYYCRGLKQGLERFKVVRDCIPKSVKVILKRYCTEYEVGGMRICASNKLPPKLTPEQLTFERYAIDNYVPEENKISKQPEYVIREVLRRWIHYARVNGDLTYKEFTGGTPLYHEVVTYQDGDKKYAT